MVEAAKKSRHPVKGIDHCVVLVNDLDAAADQFRALGFALSERGMHSAAKGSANYTMMFPDDYFELLGIVAPTQGNAARRQSLADAGQGLHAIACRIDDVTGADADLAAHGLSTGEVSHFARPVSLPGSQTGQAAFSTLPFAPEVVPRGTVFMCQHKTRDMVWLPELLNHPNTACGLAAVLAVSDAPAEEGTYFARLWSEGRVDVQRDAVIVETGAASAPILLMTSAQMHACYPGVDLKTTAQGAFCALRIKVLDLDVALAGVERAGIAVLKTSFGFAIPPAHAAGTILEFISA